MGPVLWRQGKEYLADILTFRAMVNIKSMNRSPADMQYVIRRTNIGESGRCQGKCLLMIGSGIDPTIDLQMFHGGYSGIGSASLASSSRDVPILQDLIG